MSRRLLALLCIALPLVGSRVSAAQSVTVLPLTVGPITVTSAVAGQEPTSVSMSGGTYTLVLKKNQGIGTLTARLASPLPANATLSVTLAAPGGGAVSVGAVALTTGAQPVVTGLPNSNTTLSNKSITYSFAAKSAAGVFTQTVNVVLELAP